jgi:hypothetical protein
MNQNQHRYTSDNPPGEGDSSPWGIIDIAEERAPGIVAVSTPGHGGVWLSDARLAQLHPLLAAHKPFTGDAAWFEEDCDAVIPVLAFPDVFGFQAVAFALRTVGIKMTDSPDYFSHVRQWLDATVPGQTLMVQALVFAIGHRPDPQAARIFSKDAMAE